MRQYAILFLSTIVLHRLVAQTTVSQKVYFDTDKYELTAGARSQLEGIADSLKKYRSYTVELTGHTDADGSIQYNVDLSQKRAAAVKKFLQRRGVKSVNNINWKGESTPRAENTTGVGKQKNRRVEVVIKYDKDEPKQMVNNADKSSINDLYKLLKRNSQVFCINPYKDTVLKSEAGMYVFIKANTFTISALRRSAACVEITLDEAFNKSDMLLADLSTASDNRMLITDGMFFLDAKYNGTALSAKPGGILTFMPTGNFDPDMRLFTGDKNAHSSEMNWLLNNTNVLDSIDPDDFEYCNKEYSSRKIKYECGSFGCKVKNVFRQVLGKDKIYKTRTMSKVKNRKCEKMSALYLKYGVRDFQKLAEAMKKERMMEIEQKITASVNDVSVDDMSYYLFNTPKLGWINCDRFAKYDDSRLANLKVKMAPNAHADVKIVFKDMKSIMAGAVTTTGYEFDKIPKEQMVWLVAIKYENGQAFLAIKEITIGHSDVNDLAFEKCTIAQLKEKLKVLDS